MSVRQSAFALVLAVCVSASCAVAQDAESPADDAPPSAADLPEVEYGLGSETGLRVPRFVSLRAGMGRVRRGPGVDYRIDWEFTMRGMPMEVIGEYGHWRRVRIWDGSSGWMHYALLSGTRSVIVMDDSVPMRIKPDADSAISAIAGSGVVATLGKCNADWCHIRVDGHRGWVRKPSLWGVYPGEIRD